jgi:hypothetical protein
LGRFAHGLHEPVAQELGGTRTPRGGSLAPLQGGVRYLSADGAVVVILTDRRWL